MFVEFANAISVDRALKLASRGLAVVNGKRFKIYKAGSGTYIYVKSRKNKVRSMSETNIFDIGKVAKRQAQNVPGGYQTYRQIGAGGGRGRGRGRRRR